MSTTTTERECVWTQVELEGSEFDTSCGERADFTDYPSDLGMKFCCYCGAKLIEERAEEPEDEDEGEVGQEADKE